MAYKKIYPSKVSFDLSGRTLSMGSTGKTQYNPDIWAIKYLFDKNMGNVPSRVYINGAISKTMALRMYYLKNLFPNIEFHDNEGDSYVNNAEEIIKNVGQKYVTYTSSNHPLDNRGTKDKLESQIEKELTDNLSKFIVDFSAKVKVVRQFPANIFRNTINEKNRITDKLWIDMVSVNKAQELSPVELKVGGNIPLDLFAQGLDYGIYCHLFKRHIKENWFNVSNDSKPSKITIYYIGEDFHPALIGRGKEAGIISLIRKNELLDIVFIKIVVDKYSQRITGKPEICFDTRKQCNS